MSIAETPIAALLRGQRRTGDGVHLVARDYKKGVRSTPTYTARRNWCMQLAAALGYASVPAFSHAFRQVTGKTPTEFSEMK